MKKYFSKYIGTKDFYRMVLGILIPVIIQNGIQNLVSLLDNTMVGTLGTEQMSGVSIVNQYYFVYTLLIFGVISASGIFTAQYYGMKDYEGVRATFRCKLYMALFAGIAAMGVFVAYDESLIGAFLYDGSAEGNLELTMQYAKDYLYIIIIGFMPYAVSCAYSSTMRETGETVIPMIASLTSVGTNAILNLILIFGYLGFPALGVKGAAIATVISRFVELVVLLVYAYKKKSHCAYFRGAFKSLAIPAALLKKISVKGFPLLANELLWALSITLRNQCYATRGLDSVAAQNIASTLTNLFSIVFLSMGTAISIIIGNLLGAGEFDEADDTAGKLIAFSVVASAAAGVLLAISGLFFPLIFNTTDEARSIATYMIFIYAVCNPIWAYINASYYTIRSGGKVFLTMISDSIFMWIFVVPVAYFAANNTGMNIYWLYLAGTAAECMKAVLGKYLLGRKTWRCKIVSDAL